MTMRHAKQIWLTSLLLFALSPVTLHAAPQKIFAVSQIQPGGAGEVAGAPSDSVLFYDVTDIGNGATSGVFNNDPLFAVWMGFEILQGQVGDDPNGASLGNREEFSALTVNPANGTIYAAAFDSGTTGVADPVNDTQGDFDLYRIDYQAILADFVSESRPKGTIYAPKTLNIDTFDEDFLRINGSSFYDGTVDGLANDVPHPSDPTGANTVHLDGAFQKIGEPGRSLSPASFFDYQLEFVDPETLVFMDANIGTGTPADEDFAIKVWNRVSTSQGAASQPAPFPQPPNQEGGYNSVNNTESWESSVAGRLELDPDTETNPAGFTLVNTDGVLGVWAADSDGGGDDIAFYEIDLNAPGGATATKKELANTLVGGTGPGLATQFGLAEDPASDATTNDAEIDALFVDKDGNLVIVESGFFDPDPSGLGQTGADFDDPADGVGDPALEPRVITVGIDSYDSPDSDASGQNEVLASGPAGTGFADTDPFTVSAFVPVSGAIDNDTAVTNSTRVTLDKSTGYLYIIDQDTGFSEDIYVFDPATGTIVYSELNPFNIGIFNDDTSLVFTRGDINNDGVVDGGDLTALGDAVAAPTALLNEWYDLTGDGVITNDDILELQAIIGSTPGDFDADGDVDGADFLEWQRSDGTASGLTDWQENYGSGVASLSASSAAVPEPTAFVLCVGIGVLVLVQRRN
ncbi:MAG: dockerin type I repeat-containing protein [Planctomycetota bacterium]